MELIRDRISYSVPDSFFPIQDAVPKLANGAPKTQYAAQLPDKDVDPEHMLTLSRKWSTHFQGPRARTQLRAWSRVQLPSQSTRNCTGTIMKRVGLPIPRPLKATAIPAPATTNTIETPVMAEDGMPLRRVLRRLDSYEASEAECETQGKPLSKLEMAGLQIQAKGKKTVLSFNGSGL